MKYINKWVNTNVILLTCESLDQVNRTNIRAIQLWFLVFMCYSNWFGSIRAPASCKWIFFPLLKNYINWQSMIFSEKIK